MTRLRLPYMSAALRNLLELHGFNACPKRTGFDSIEYMTHLGAGDPWAWVVYRNTTGRRIGQIGSRCTIEQWVKFLQQMGDLTP